MSTPSHKILSIKSQIPHTAHVLKPFWRSFLNFILYSSHVLDDPVVTLTPAMDPQEGNATDNVTLTCSWNSTVFYLVWFKNGTPLYSRNLVSGVTEDSTGGSVAVEAGGLNSTLTFSRVSDSGNYTCAVTCRAKDRAEEDIPVQFKATKEVLIYGGLTAWNRSSSNTLIVAVQGRSRSISV